MDATILSLLPSDQIEDPACQLRDRAQQGMTGFRLPLASPFGIGDAGQGHLQTKPQPSSRSAPQMARPKSMSAGASSILPNISWVESRMLITVWPQSRTGRVNSAGRPEERLPQAPSGHEIRKARLVMRAKPGLAVCAATVERFGNCAEVKGEARTWHRGLCFIEVWRDGLGKRCATITMRN